LLVCPATGLDTSLEIPVGELPGRCYKRRKHCTTTNGSGIREYVYGDAANRILPLPVQIGLMVKDLTQPRMWWVILDYKKACPGQEPVMIQLRKLR